MLPVRFTRMTNPQRVFTDVMSGHVYYENGKEHIDDTGKNILAEWSTLHGMSFDNPKYLRTWRAEQKEMWAISNPSRYRKKHISLQPDDIEFDSRAKDFRVVCKKKIWKGNYPKSGNYCYPSCV